MSHQPLTALLAAAETTGSHPGPAFFALWALVVAGVIGGPVYLVRLMRNRRSERERVSPRDRVRADR